MLIGEKKNPKKLPTCPADYVVDIPRLILNSRHKIQYECVQYLGAGAYGKCVEVVKKSTSEHFACKIFSKNLISKHNELKELVQNEMKIHCRLKHKHIVAFIESFEDTKHVYMIQSLCSNNSLERLKVKRGTVSINECRYFVHQILQGVKYIHDKGFIHRDLKLSNILLTDNVQVKICDFGLAVHIDDTRLSRSICGTKYYIAPEVVNRMGFVRRSDVWSIGIISFVLVFGLQPFQQDYSIDKFNEYLNEYSVDCDYRQFLRATLETSIIKRPTSEQCLSLDFFTKYHIPRALSLETVSNDPPIENTITFSSFNATPKNTAMDPSHYRTAVSNKTDTLIDFGIDYPEIHIVIGSVLDPFREYTKYALELECVSECFDNICRLHQVNSCVSSNIIDLGGSNCFEPNYWVAKWSYNARQTTEFTYLLSDGTLGSILQSGIHFKRTPDNVCWILEWGSDSFHRVSDEIEKRELKNSLTNFHAVGGQHKHFWHYIAETKFNSSNSHHLITWIKTDQAMIMLLSDNTFQINFAENHKKLLISPQFQTVTFIKDTIKRSNFTTISYKALACQWFSTEHFELLKYVTASLKLLTQTLNPVHHSNLTFS